jgi:hypothetical protein
VRGYAPQSDELGVDAGDIALQQAALAELAQRKQELAQELAGYAVAAEAAGRLPGGGGGGGGARPEARVDGAISINRAALVCELTLMAAGGDDLVIKVGA